jgi:DNA-binding NarL/FixJ family response regulator
VEDQVILRDSLARLLSAQADMQVVAETGNAGEAAALCKQTSPNLALMDVVTEGASTGIAVAGELRKSFPDLKIVIMTGMPEITFIDSAKKAGVDSFVYKNVKSDTLLSAIRATMDGYSIFPANEPTGLPGNLRFNEKEITVLRLVCEAKSRQEIAAELLMSEGSVKAIITSILNKTGYDSIMKFAIYAMAHGYILPNA